MSEHLRPGWYARAPDGQTESWWDGERWTGETRPAPRAEPSYVESARERVGRRMVYGGLSAVGAVVVLMIGAMAFGGSSDDDPESDVMSEGEARFVCEDFVRDRLKSPGSAEFQSPDTSLLTNTVGRSTEPSTPRMASAPSSDPPTGASCVTRATGWRA